MQKIKFLFLLRFADFLGTNSPCTKNNKEIKYTKQIKDISSYLCTWNRKIKSRTFLLKILYYIPIDSKNR